MMRLHHFLYSLVAALLVVMLACDVSQPRSIDKLFPADAVINVKTVYGAKGNGVTDDTQAIRKAIRANVGKGKTLYFPQGTYLVSDRLDWRDSNGNWQAHLTLQGQNRNTTIIKLQDNASGYTKPNQHKAVIFTASQNPNDPAIGTGNQAFDNLIFDLTIDTGKGNPGAIGIDYMGNNMGAIRNVTIRSGDGLGGVGLQMKRSWPGPCLIKNVAIQGFDYGINLSNYQYGITFEFLKLANLNKEGIRNYDNVLSIRGLTSTNVSGPVINNLTQAGFVTVIDSNFSGGLSSVSAIQNQGTLYVRNLVTSGYQSAIKQKTSVISGSNVSEFVSDKSLSLFSSTGSLNLPVEETPTFHDNDLNNWANVKKFGAVPDDYLDDTAAIQQAMDSGKSTIYFPKGMYRVSKTIHVRGQVQRVLGMQSWINIGPNTAFSDPANPHAIFRVEDGASAVVTIERMNFLYSTAQYPFKGGINIEHASPDALVLRDINMLSEPKYSYHNAAGAGKLFIENVASIAPWKFEYPQSVWARQFDPEVGKQPSGSLVYKNGGTFWILGLKTEGARTVLETTGGAKTQLLGGLIYPIAQVPSDLPAIISTDSISSLSYSVCANSSATNYNIQLQETKDGVTKTFTRTQLPPPGGNIYTAASVMPLYIRND